MSGIYEALKTHENNMAQLDSALASAELTDVYNDEVRLFLHTLAANGIVIAAEHTGSVKPEKKPRKQRKARKAKETPATPASEE